MAGYYQCCNCCGREFNSAPGARAYLFHLSQATYYGIRMSPEATWALGALAREFLRGPTHFSQWLVEYYPGWQPSGPDVIPGAYGWFNCR